MPRHSHKGVTDFLNGKLPEKWVGRWWAWHLATLFAWHYSP
jgi:hypothetical protein